MQIDAAIRNFARRDARRAADAILVLGCSVTGDGLPGPLLAERVRHAEDLYHEGLAPVILMSGGLGKSGFVEAEAARKLALADGIPASAILTEEHSTNTWENFVNSREVMAEHGLHSALVSTDPLHEWRSIQIGRELGLNVYPSPVERGPATDPATEPQRLQREVQSALIYEQFRQQRAAQA